MRMSVNEKKAFNFLLIIIGLFALLNGCGQKGFDGTRVANPDSYRLDMEQMNGTDTHTMKLDAGDLLEIHFETGQGKLHMEIKSPDGILVYAGNGEEATDFTVNISESGVYSVSVEAHNAKGKIHIQRQQVGTGMVSTPGEE